MEPRIIHIQDLPIEKIYIDLNDEFRIEIIDKAKKELRGNSRKGTYNLANI